MEELLKDIENYLDENLDKFNLTKEEDGYSVELTTASCELSDKDVQKILKDDYPLDSFYEIIDNLHEYEEDELKESTIEEILEDYRKTNTDANEEYEEGLIDWLKEKIYVVYGSNIDDYYNQEILIDVIIDAGDCNYDYTLNSFHERVDPNYPDETEKYLPEKSGLLWLVKQQGYTDDDIVNIINSDFPLIESEFLQSVINEVYNATTHTNALTFLVKIRLENAMAVMGRKEDITLPKDSKCGLYDPWNGAGSVLEIKLEKDVVIPWDIIDSFQVDGYRGYSISEIYGVDEAFWKNTLIIKHNEL